MLKPAMNTTDDPPVPIQNVLLLEYVHELRRRIEIQMIQMTELAQEIKTLRDQNERLNLDVHFYQEAALRAAS